MCYAFTLFHLISQRRCKLDNDDNVLRIHKESACNAGDPGSTPGWGSSPGEGIGYPLQYSWTPLMVQIVKNPPAMWETWVRSLGWEDPLEKGTATHSSILAWRIPRTEESGGLQSMGSQRVGHNWVAFNFTTISPFRKQKSGFPKEERLKKWPILLFSKSISPKILSLIKTLQLKVFLWVCVCLKSSYSSMWGRFLQIPEGSPQ